MAWSVFIWCRGGRIEEGEVTVMKAVWRWNGKGKSQNVAPHGVFFLETESNKGDPSPHASCAHSLCARNAYPTTQGMWTLSAPTMLTTTLTHSPCPASLTSFFPLIHCILLFLQEFNKNEKKNGGGTQSHIRLL